MTFTDQCLTLQRLVLGRKDQGKPVERITLHEARQNDVQRVIDAQINALRGGTVSRHGEVFTVDSQPSYNLKIFDVPVVFSQRNLGEWGFRLEP